MLLLPFTLLSNTRKGEWYQGFKKKTNPDVIVINCSDNLSGKEEQGWTVRFKRKPSTSHPTCTKPAECQNLICLEIKFPEFSPLLLEFYFSLSPRNLHDSEELFSIFFSILFIFISSCSALVQIHIDSKGS